MSSTQQAIPHRQSYTAAKPRLQLSWLNTIFKRSIAIILFLLLWESQVVEKQLY